MILWQMGKPQRYMLQPLTKHNGRYYCHIVVVWQMVSYLACMLSHLLMADVIAKVSDGMATQDGLI